MAIRLFAKQDKPWVIILRPIEDSVAVEIRTPPLWKHFPSAYIDLLDRILQDYEILALSQLIDERQWREEIPNRQEYVHAIGRKFSVQTVITAAYDTVEQPEPTSDSFVVHLVGRPSRTLLQETLGFGMDSLPHIMYGLRRTPDSWPLETLSWNGVFVRWFRLKEEDEALMKLVLRSGLVLWTADHYLSLVLPQASGADRVLAHVEDVAQGTGLHADVRWTGLTG